MALVAGAAVGAALAIGAPGTPPGDDVDRLIAELTDDGQSLRSGALQEGFDAFTRLMDAHDGERAVALARAMHGRAGEVWSAFCLEGALRRSAPADAGPGSPALAEAAGALDALLARTPELPLRDRIDVLQRKAILHAGFGDRAAERRALGAALALGGVDAAQIRALQALQQGDPETGARLFASLLDRHENGPLPPWALRGFGLCCVEIALE